MNILQIMPTYQFPILQLKYVKICKKFDGTSCYSAGLKPFVMG